MSIRQQSIEYLNCPNPHHKKQLLISVCIDKNCANRTLMCYVCEKEQHPGHQTLTLNEFMELSDQRASVEPDKTVVEAVKESVQKIQASKAKCLETLAAAKSQITTTMKSLEKAVIDFFAGKETQALGSYNSCAGRGFVYTHKKKVDKVIDDFKKMLRNFKTQCNIESIKPFFLEEIQNIINNCQIREKQLQLSLDTLIIDLSEAVRKDFEMMNINQSTIQNSRSQPADSPRRLIKNSRQQSKDMCACKGLSRWSKIFKHPDIQILGAQARRTQDSLKCKHVCVLMENIMEDTQLQTILIKEKVCGIILGVCLESKIKSYVKEDWATIGHGHYVIANDGLVWSHSDRLVNYKVKSFRFNTSDQIQIYFKKSTNRMQFIKSSTSEKWELQVEPLQPGDSYKLCAYLFMKGDSVVLLQKRNA